MKHKGCFWQYCIVKDGNTFGIYEHYDLGTGAGAITSKPEAVTGESVQDVMVTLIRMGADISRYPVLEYKNGKLRRYKYDKHKHKK